MNPIITLGAGMLVLVSIGAIVLLLVGIGGASENDRSPGHPKDRMVEGMKDKTPSRGSSRDAA